MHSTLCTPLQFLPPPAAAAAAAVLLLCCCYACGRSAAAPAAVIAVSSYVIPCCCSQLLASAAGIAVHAVFRCPSLLWLSRCSTVQATVRSYNVKCLSPQLGVIRPSLGQAAVPVYYCLCNSQFLSRQRQTISHAQPCRHLLPKRLLWQLAAVATCCCGNFRISTS